MSERLSITPLGPYIGAQISGADLTRPLSDNQFEQLYHAVLRHQVVFLRDQAITPQQQRALAQRFGELHIHPVYPHAEGVDEIIVLDTHNDNPPDNDNWHTDVTFIETPPAGAILAAKELPSTGGDTLWTSGIAAYEALSVPFRQLLNGCVRSMISVNRSRNTNTAKPRRNINAGARRSRKIRRCYIRWCERIR
ncbi:hypothetical protein ZA09C12_13780 [Escherichia coli]|nr:hypothetical protein VEE11_33990 [Escherichia coli]